MRPAKHILAAVFLLMPAAGMIAVLAAESPGDKPGTIAPASPQSTGEIDKSYWGNLSEAQQTEAVGALKTFAQNAADTLKHPLHLQETKYFLLYSDLSVIAAAHDAELLEKMYKMLSELFGVPRGQDLWRGKALFFVFTRVEDYRLYERMVENDDPGASFAMTHCFGDGMVHSAFYKYPDQTEFEHLLVHESVHGFLHRYRTPERIPSWANEGLADELASELIANPRRGALMLGLTRNGLEKHDKSAGDFFTARHIDGWQYPLAETLTAWMIHKNGQGYLEFINGIKDGQPWDQSLKKNFKMTPEKMLAEYAKTTGFKGLKT